VNNKKLASVAACAVSALVFVAAALMVFLVMLVLLLATGIVYRGWGLLLLLVCVPLALAGGTFTYQHALRLENS